MLTTDEDFLEYAENPSKAKPSKIADMLTERAFALYDEKVALVGEERFKEIERAVLLQNVDRNWMEHIDAMDDLKDTIRLQSYAQRDPVNEYRIQGADMFDAMVEEIREATVRMILTITPKQPNLTRVEIAKPTVAGFAGATVKKTVVKRESEKISPNAPCPCGSGKKYKKCCALRESSNS